MTAPGKISYQLEQALRDFHPPKRDAAAVALAKHLAHQIDEAPEEKRLAVLSDLSPKLLATLTALGMTAAGRSKAGEKGGGADAPLSPLDRARAARDELHARREQRAREHAP